MKAAEYIDDLKKSKVLDPTNVAVVKGFVAAYEDCSSLKETRLFVQSLRELVGSQFLEQLATQVRKDPTLTHRYLAGINRALEEWERGQK